MVKVCGRRCMLSISFLVFVIVVVDEKSIPVTPTTIVT